MRMFVLLFLISTVSVQASEKRVWGNVPAWDPVQSSVNYFPLMRVVSHSGVPLYQTLGIEDVHFNHFTHVTRIEFLSLDSGNPVIQYGDWFVLDGYQYTGAFQVIRSGIGVPILRIPLNVIHMSGAQVILNVMFPENLWLQAGDYYFGFRTMQYESNSYLGQSWALAYQGSKGWTRAGWSSNVDIFGQIGTSGFFYFDSFNYVYDLEWAMGVFGETF